MELLVLVDNNTYIDVDAAGEPGASFVLDDGEQRILFDMGITDIFLKNGHNIIEVKLFSLFRNREPVNNGKYSAAAAGKKLKYSHSGIA